LPKGFKLENKWYPPTIFRLSSQDHQKDQLKEWSEKKGKRSVATMKKQIKDELKNEMKKKGGDDKDSNDDESSADDAAGKKFGHGAHKKKQKKDGLVLTVAMVSRAVYSVNYDAMRGDGHRSGRCEMDSHTDTCVAERNCVVLEYNGRKAEVEV
jgi:hypothetical protein